jgi:hypothetical protein
LRPVNGETPQPVELTWGAVDNAVRYEVELAAGPDFMRVEKTLTAEEPKQVLEGREAGDVFWRVVSVDGDGLRSRPSAMFRLRLP